MRLIDDAVDEIPKRSQLSDDAKRSELKRVDEWLGSVVRTHSGEIVPGATWPALADTFAHFELPLTPWKSLAQAMSRDVDTSSFQTWAQLRDYMSGASVAPAVVFMYLVLMKPGQTGRFRTDWSYDDVRTVTEDLAVFCYLTHILRDVATDLSLGETGLVYLPSEDLNRFGLMETDLHAMRSTGRATAPYKSLGLFIAERARRYLSRGQSRLSQVLDDASENGPALTFLVSTYVDILNSLEARGFDVFAQQSDPAR